MAGKMHHIHLAPGDVGRYVLLPGDPGRVAEIATYLDHARPVASNREYTTYTGFIDGMKVSVMSTGIGGPSTVIGVEELIKIGADTFIRVGTCGGMQEHIPVGDVVIANGAIRAEGTSHEYMPAAFPAVSDFDVLCALKEGAEQAGVPHHVGVVQCKDSFYGQHEPDTMPVAPHLHAMWDAWVAGGCLASEMETAALFILASVRRVRAGSLCLVAGNGLRASLGYQERSVQNNEASIRTAVEGLRCLIRRDSGKESAAGQ